jgi:hypothetical protein
MRDLTKVERAAMWLYNDEYGASRLGAIEFWADLSNYRQNNVRQMIHDIEACQTFEIVLGESKVK